MAGASLLERLRALIAESGAESVDTPDNPSENPEPVGQGENPSTEPDAAQIEADATVDAGTSTPEGDGGQTLTPEDAEQTLTLDDGEGLTDTQRDDMNKVAAENEALRLENQRLRDRIAELGGDAALGIVEEVTDPAENPDPDATDEYDPDSDVSEQEAEIAAIRAS